jgi:hypothetical protein
VCVWKMGSGFDDGQPYIESRIKAERDPARKPGMSRRSYAFLRLSVHISTQAGEEERLFAYS